jgi:hypothetical protein
MGDGIWDMGLGLGIGMGLWQMGWDNGIWDGIWDGMGHGIFPIPCLWVASIVQQTLISYFINYIKSNVFNLDSGDLLKTIFNINFDSFNSMYEIIIMLKLNLVKQFHFYQQV